jgi:hypothetical protein
MMAGNSLRRRLTRDGRRVGLLTHSSYTTRWDTTHAHAIPPAPPETDP